MDDRELVARKLNPYAWEKESNDWEMTMMVENLRNQSLSQADDLLTALAEAGRLLPVLPEWVERYGGEMTTDGGWTARLMDRDYKRMTLKATGPTIAAAMSDALKEHKGEQPIQTP